jgi:hypothetical protein
VTDLLVDGCAVVCLVQLVSVTTSWLLFMLARLFLVLVLLILLVRLWLMGMLLLVRWLLLLLLSCEI